MDIDVKLEHLNLILVILTRYLGADAKIYAFGSRVKKSAKPYSDLDIAVDLVDNKLDLETLAKIKSSLDDTTIPYFVDIVDLNGITEEFKNNINKDLVLLN